MTSGSLHDGWPKISRSPGRQIVAFWLSFPRRILIRCTPPVAFLRRRSKEPTTVMLRLMQEQIQLRSTRPGQPHTIPKHHRSRRCAHPDVAIRAVAGPHPTVTEVQTLPRRLHRVRPSESPIDPPVEILAVDS